MSVKLQHFNPRARVGRDLHFSRNERQVAAFQSTRPRGARLADFAIEATIPPISIHAPAWGATSLLPSPSLQCSYFNPRARVGRDSRQKCLDDCPLHFNPRARVGRDLSCTLPNGMRKGFQSTRPRGARRRGVLYFAAMHIISIHAPAWGATDCLPALMMAGNISIHAPAWGATASASQKTADGYISIHAPAWGATRQAMQQKMSWKISIHAPAWGATMPDAFVPAV